VCACLWCADACVQGVPVARTAGVRYASSSGRAKPKSSAHGQRDVAVCLTSSAASAFSGGSETHGTPATRNRPPHTKRRSQTRT